MKSRSIPIIAMGVSAILLQTAGLRQLLAVFSGNELDIGITLSVWLAATGAGSYAGHRFKSENAYAFSFIAVAVLAQPTVLLMNLIRPVLSTAPGEIISLPATFLATVFSLLPLCFVVGMQFPLAVYYSGGEAAKTYGLEAAGAFLGGALFTFFLSNSVDISALSALVSAINLIIAVFLLRKKSLFALLLIPVVFYIGINRVDRLLLWKGFELTEKTESRYGEITVLRERGQANVYSSAKFLFAYPDPQTEELRAHLSMTMHSSPSRVLVVGGSPAVLREILKYPDVKVDFVETDPEMINVSFRLLSAEDREILKDKRLRIINGDARRYIKRLNSPDYDIMLLNLSEPSTANTNRFYTTDFFKEAGAVIGEKGIISLKLQSSSGYISKRMQTANGAVYNSLKNVFRYVEVSSEEYGYVFASGSPIDTNPETLGRRFEGRGLHTKFFYPYIFYDVFSPLRITMVKERLRNIDAVNSDSRPVAYLYNLMLWAEVYGGDMLNQLGCESQRLFVIKGWQLIFAACAAFIIAAVFLWRQKKAVYYSMFTTGYSAMAFSIIMILSYQALYGYIYQRIGLFTAVFMAGMSAGALASKKLQAPLKWLRIFEIAGAALFISSPLFLVNEALFYLPVLLCGIIAGIQFAAANLCMKKKETTETAGKMYALDLAGSFSGAALTAIFFVPLLGIGNALLFLALIKCISFILLLSVGYEKS